MNTEHDKPTPPPGFKLVKACELKAPFSDRLLVYEDEWNESYYPGSGYDKIKAEDLGGWYATPIETPTDCPQSLLDAANFARKLERERDELKRWKAEMMQVGGWWLTVDEAVRKHPDAIVGHNVSDTALRFIRERDEAREANTTLQAREAELVLSKERISKRAEAIRCELVEKEKQLEAMREAIKEAHEAISQCLKYILKLPLSGSAEECETMDHAHHALRKLKPFIND